MQRPDTVPANANWNPEDNQWELGQYNPANEKTGIWQSWHIDGHLCGTLDYKEGTPPFLFKRFHPDGTIAQEGNWYGENIWLGTYRWIRSEDPTPEPFPSGVANIWTVEFEYEKAGIYYTQRFFDKHHQPLSVSGAQLPERPVNVPVSAHFADAAGRWISGEVDTLKGRYVGLYQEWDTKGLQTNKLVFDYATCAQVEEHKFRKGKVWLSKKRLAEGQELQSFYYDDIAPAMVENNILFSNGDETYTFFDKAGKLLYTIRNEGMRTGLHRRRYYNDQLIFESIQTADHTKPPVSVHYYYPDGTVIIDYQSNGDGTGNWHLYEQDGKMALTLPVPEEADYNEFIGWQIFLSFDLDTKTTGHEWELMKEKFISRYTREVIEQKVDALPVPAFLQHELEKTNWSEIDAAMGGSKYLPKYINGLLVDDQEIADKCLADLWMQIEHQGSVYASTYAVAQIAANMLSYYTGAALIQTRLLHFLYEVMALPNIHDYRELYQQLATSLTLHVDLLSAQADSEDDTIATQSLYLLLHAGTERVEVLDQFKAVWNHTGYSPFRRSYAVFLLGLLYLRNRQEEFLIDEFAPALDNIQEPLIRVVMLIHLVTAAKSGAAESWCKELIHLLGDAENIGDDFSRLRTLTGGYDLQEYILMLFRYANPEILSANIDMVIDMLPDVNSLKQETLLHTILSVLFPEPDSVEDLTPIRQKALLAAAALVDTDVIFVNHTSLLRDYGLPTTTPELKKLAGG